MAKEPKMVTCKHCGEKRKLSFRKNFLLIAFAVFTMLVSTTACNVDFDDDGNADSVDAILDKANEALDKAADTITDDTDDENEADPAVTNITYTPYAVSELISDLDSNAFRAASKYEDQYVELTGILGVIDSSGDYICIEPSDDEYSWTDVKCYLRSDDQKDVVLELQQGDSIVVKGKITSVGEVLGYSLTIDEISKAG